MQMTVYFIFLDGVGLGLDEPAINPLASNPMPKLSQMLGGVRLLGGVAPVHTTKASLLALDANLGVAGLPQSATGQAVLITGTNVPAKIGYHYGPKPDPATAAHLNGGGLFGALTRNGKRVRFLNAYPQRYFDTIENGKHLYSSFPQAAVNGGVALLTADDLRSGIAVSADITGAGWAEHLGVYDIQTQQPEQVGRNIAETCNGLHLAFFEYWSTDYAGHKQDMPAALAMLAQIDDMLAGLAHHMGTNDLILVTSDHGNMEDLAVRRHTANPVPLVLIGSQKARQPFLQAGNLADVTPGILQALGLPGQV